MFDLNGKVAIVTGANQGLGFAMCQGLAKAGADIFNIGRREDDHVIREAVEREGVKYHYYRADLSNPTVEKMDEIVEKVIKVYGHVDILLNNAGANIREPFLEYDVKDWDYILNLNLKSIFLLSQSVAKQMIAPGYMDTPLTKPMQEDPVRNKEVLDRIPAGYWGKPETLQGAAIFLASEASDYVCGATIPVDGGWLSR